MAIEGGGAPWKFYYDVGEKILQAGATSQQRALLDYQRKYTDTERDLHDKATRKSWKERFGKDPDKYSITQIKTLLRQEGFGDLLNTASGLSADAQMAGRPLQFEGRAIDAMLGVGSPQQAAQILGIEVPRILDETRSGITFDEQGFLKAAEGYEFVSGKMLPEPKAPGGWEDKTPKQRQKYAERVGWDVTDAAIKTLIGGKAGGGITSTSDPTDPTFVGPQPDSVTNPVPDGTSTNDPQDNPNVTIDPVSGLPTGGSNNGGQQVPNSWYEDNKGWLDPLIGVGGSLLGGGIDAYGNITAGKDVADAIREQGQMQDKLSRDVMATGIEYANEQRDIGLGMGEPWRIAGVTALAGMADMTGLKRDYVDAPQNAINGFQADGSRQNTPGGGVFGRQDGVYGVMRENGKFIPKPDRDPAAGGTSSYQSEFGYDMNRIDEVSGIYQNAEQFNFEADPGYQFRLSEGLRGLDQSAASRGQARSGGHEKAVIEAAGNYASQEYSKIFDRLSMIAGFGPGASGTPDASAGTSTINQQGGNIVAAANTVGQAGLYQGAGRASAFGAFGDAFGDAGRIWGNRANG